MAPAMAFHIDPDEWAEAYVMGQMGSADRAHYAEHLERCVACAEAVEEQGTFVAAMRAAMAGQKGKGRE